MPLYEWSCVCGKTADEFRRMAERNLPKACDCGQPMTRVITSYRAISDLDPYYDENLESWVKSKRDRQRIMREQGVSEMFGKGWR